MQQMNSQIIERKNVANELSDHRKTNVANGLTLHMQKVGISKNTKKPTRQFIEMLHSQKHGLRK